MFNLVTVTFMIFILFKTPKKNAPIHIELERLFIKSFLIKHLI